jgi:hypothetical protein
MEWLIDGNIIKLPEYRQINLVSGVDRYGFSSLLAERLGLLRPRRSFANWQHGWVWWGATSYEELMMDNGLKDQSQFIVSKSAELDVLNSAGFKNVWVGGLPFAYTEPSKSRKVPGSLLAMPMHSAEQTNKTTTNKLAKSLTDYLDFLESLKSQFSSVWLSIYYLDFSTPLLDEISRRGLFAIEGARPNDANSLKRVRTIMDTFEFVTTNSIGSHVIYAMFSGCKVSVSGPEFLVEESDFLFDNCFKSFSKKYIEDSVYYLSRKYLEIKFPFILVDNPMNGFQSEEFASEEIGFYNRLTNEDILDALQWSRVGQLKGYSLGGMRRIERALVRR